jgi:ABC-2 type transport system permease protein
MNVFLHELRALRKSTVIWSVCVIALMIVSMAKYQTVTAQGGQAMQAMLKSFPNTIQAVFGMNGLDLTTVAGYFGVCFLFLAVMAAVHAGLLGANVLADEEINKTTEFLYVKPRTRMAIITAKLLAGSVCLAVVWGAAAVGSAVGIIKFATFGGFVGDFWICMIALALMQLMFFALGAMAVAISRSATAYGKIVAGIVFGSYLLYVFAKLSPSLGWMHYGSVFSWFDAAYIVSAHALKLHYVVLTLVVAIGALLLTYIVYSQRDLRV